MCNFRKRFESSPVPLWTFYLVVGLSSTFLASYEQIKYYRWVVILIITLLLVMIIIRMVIVQEPDLEVESKKKKRESAIEKIDETLMYLSTILFLLGMGVIVAQ